MKYNDALSRLKTEDSFYDQANRSYKIYLKSGGTALTQDDFLDLFIAHISPQHIARKEKDFKEKSHISTNKIKEQILKYFKGKIN